MEAIRARMVAKRSARAERTQTVNQARSLIVTGPDDLRARFAGHTVAPWSATWRAAAPPRQHRRLRDGIALRELGRGAEFLDGQMDRLDELIIGLVRARAQACCEVGSACADSWAFAHCT